MAPASGGVFDWEGSTTFTARSVAGASEYCWNFDGIGSNVFRRCSSSTSFVLTGGRNNPGAGPISVTAEARAADGSVVDSGRITVTLLSLQVITEPDPGDELDLSRRIVLRARAVPNASRYCWTIGQGSSTSSPICGSGPSATLGRNDPALAALGPGPALIRVVADRDGVELGRQAVSVQLVD